MSGKVNILHITESLDIGGLEVLLLELLKKLDKRRYDHAVCVLKEDGRLVEDREHLLRLGLRYR